VLQLHYFFTLKTNCNTFSLRQL